MEAEIVQLRLKAAEQEAKLKAAENEKNQAVKKTEHRWKARVQELEEENATLLRDRRQYAMRSSGLARHAAARRRETKMTSGGLGELSLNAT